MSDYIFKKGDRVNILNPLIKDGIAYCDLLVESIFFGTITNENYKNERGYIYVTIKLDGDSKNDGFVISTKYLTLIHDSSKQIEEGEQEV